jgi:hypothetical protein
VGRLNICAAGVRRVAGGYVATMTIALVVGICVLLLILGFLAPRLSSKPQRGVNRAFSAGGNTAARAPGGAGRWLRKPFDASNRAANKSASAGRRGRSNMPM